MNAARAPLRHGAAAGAAVRAAAAACAAAFLAAAAPLSMREGPPSAHTGGFGEPTCHACHFQEPVNSGPGAVTLTGTPEAWEPGSEHAITVRLEHDAVAIAGFQLAARFEDGSQAGDLDPLDAERVRVVAFEGVRYATHTWDGAEPREAGVAEWMLRWTAPADGGTVVFHFVANAANDDDSPLGDLIYAGELAVPPAAPARR